MRYMSSSFSTITRLQSFVRTNMKMSPISSGTTITLPASTTITTVGRKVSSASSARISTGRKPSIESLRITTISVGLPNVQHLPIKFNQVFKHSGSRY
jgi:hypothetical protein